MRVMFRQQTSFRPLQMWVDMAYDLTYLPIDLHGSKPDHHQDNACFALLYKSINQSACHSNPTTAVSPYRH
jgi:hypothetical protein